MPTNPENIVRIRSRNGGRASVYESNMWAQKFTGGLFSGNGVRQNTSADMNVLVGGASTKPDVVIGQNAAGYNIALDIVGTQTIAITKPASNSRITAIVAYTNDLSLTSADAGTTGSPSSCGLIVVNGASSASPVAPSDSDIRAAITADGATGSQATYCVIATILVASSTTTITDTLISTRKAQLPTSGIADGAVTSGKVDFATQTDANGWTVRSIGDFKRYSKKFSATGTYTSSNTGIIVTIGTMNLPVGVTLNKANNIIITMQANNQSMDSTAYAWNGTNLVPLNSSEATGFSVRAWATYPSSTTATSVIGYVTIEV